MGRYLLILFFVITRSAGAQEVSIRVFAKGHAQQAVLLYRYDDLFTMRPVRVTEAVLDDDATADLRTAVVGTVKLRLRIGEVTADLFARPGRSYNVSFLDPEYGAPRTINGTIHGSLVFNDLDPLDVNAITTDLNDRLDAFINEDLATDEVAGMQVVDIKRKQEGPDTTQLTRPPTLFVTPSFSKARVDSFEMKLKKFYAEVKDPWFDHYFQYSIAGMRHGPRVNEEELFNAYLKDRPVRYDDPEYVRFIRSFYSEQLLLAQRFHNDVLQRAFEAGEADTLKAILATNEFLKGDDRLCELAMIDLLYQQYHSKQVQREGADRILADVAASSNYPEHRVIAANMLWDLTTMRVGARMPAMLLEDMRGNDVSIDSLLAGPVCIVFTASWCSYCDLELQGLEQLHAQYKEVVAIIAIDLDTNVAAMKNYVKAHPGMDFTWLHATAEQQLREDLRLRSLPAFYLLNDGVLARSPAPLPSNGLGALFQQAKTEAEKGSRIKVWDE